MKDSYKIQNTKLFAKSIRKNAALSFGNSYQESLDDLISINQVENLVRKYCKISDNDEFVMSERIYDKIFDKIRIWIYNSSLCSVAASDRIECCWDDTLNEMVFWTEDSKQTFNTASYKKSNDKRKRD